MHYIHLVTDGEIDEILQQLNSIELTYQQEIQVLTHEVAKKEIMNDALTHSLSESKQQKNRLEQLLKVKLQKTKESEEALGRIQVTNAQLQKQVTTTTQQLERMENQHLRDIEEATRKAQDEIRMAAEQQFAEAQKTYVQLKQEYHNTKTASDAYKKELDTTDRQHQGQMDKIMSELAESRAAMASAQADAMKLKQTYGEETQGLKDREHDLEQRLAVTEGKNKEAEIIVQRIIEEKDGLKQENQELQSLCEELMAIIEAGTNNTNKNQGVISS